MLFEDVFNKVKESSISKDTKEVLLEQYYENLIRLSMELENFNMGDNLIKENKLDTVRYHDVAGDFYKYFQENEIAIYHYDQAMSFDIDDSKKYLIKKVGGMSEERGIPDKRSESRRKETYNPLDQKF